MSHFFTPSLANDDATEASAGPVRAAEREPDRRIGDPDDERGKSTAPDILPTIHLPTLVMHRSDDVATSVEYHYEKAGAQGRS